MKLIANTANTFPKDNTNLKDKFKTNDIKKDTIPDSNSNKATTPYFPHTMAILDIHTKIDEEDESLVNKNYATRTDSNVGR